MLNAIKKINQINLNKSEGFQDFYFPSVTTFFLLQLQKSVKAFHHSESTPKPVFVLHLYYSVHKCSSLEEVDQITSGQSLDRKGRYAFNVKRSGTSESPSSSISVLSKCLPTQVQGTSPFQDCTNFGNTIVLTSVPWLNSHSCVSAKGITTPSAST